MERAALVLLARLAAGSSFAILGLFAGAVAFGAEAPLVILISMDGVRYDYPDRSTLPGFERMEREGARAERLVPVFPASTFPNHVALATGTYADRHGIVDNHFYDRARDAEFSYENDASWLDAEPLWSTAERQGLRAAVFFWVGSETDWGGFGATYRKAPFSSMTSEDEKLEQLFAWIDLPANERPQLVMMWWHGADSMGHRKGPDHPDTYAALVAQDEYLQQLLEGLDARGAWAHATLVVVSDHGMTALTREVDFDPPLDAAGLAPRVIRRASHAQFFFEQEEDSERKEAIAQAERALQGIEGLEVVRHDAIPEAWRFRHKDRTGDLMVVTSPPYYLARKGFWYRLQSTAQWLLGWTLGGHGFQPDHPDMGAIFFALGRGVPAGAKPGVVRAIDVAATVSDLLGIEPPLQSEGHSIKWIDETR